jgi:hypothetical protein
MVDRVGVILREKPVKSENRFVVGVVKYISVGSVVLAVCSGAGAEIARPSLSILGSHLRHLDRSSGYQCFRNISNYEDSELLSKVVSLRRHYREKTTGEIYAGANLTSTLPPSRIGIPESAKWLKVSEQEFVLEYDRDTTVLGQMKEISSAVQAFTRSGTVRHFFRIENGELNWIRASYDVRPWHGEQGGTRPHVRCARIVTVKGRFFGTSVVLEPLADVHLSAASCRGSGSECAEEVREPVYLK